MKGIAIPHLDKHLANINLLFCKEKVVSVKGKIYYVSIMVLF